MQLRILKQEDAKWMLEWMHDPEMYCNFRFNAENRTIEQVKDFIVKAVEDACAGREYHYAITDTTDEYLGTISLKDIDYEAGTAEYAVCLRKTAQGRGLAYMATRELLQYAFCTLRLRRIYLNVLSTNEKAIQLYEKCGFCYEGEWREHLLLRGEIVSLKWYGILKSEFTGCEG